MCVCTVVFNQYRFHSIYKLLSVVRFSVIIVNTEILSSAKQGYLTVVYASATSDCEISLQGLLFVNKPFPYDFTMMLH